ncbi:bifunctional metallophosphatase/5'-nucleotidase [Bacillus sp. 2205SS5-2]|uniref:bifunctional metallophosphatase/5'-nucleotidase n=1 Tax=Bacillus sp. 2205SS5-2 TaxID=3109031 RepID=UPI0030058FDA
MIETIHIYHTNDLHSHLENWPKISRFLKAKKREHELAGEEVVLLDLGDFVDKWHPLTEGSKGKENISLLNEVGYNAVTIGNNEGITFSYEDLSTLYSKAKFDVLVANLYEKNGERPAWAKPNIIVESKQGFKLGIAGISAYYEHFYDLLGWRMTPPLDELEKEIYDLKEVDGFLLMSHLGLGDDEWIAREHPMVDVILGGHTHHLLEEGKMVNQTLLAAAGKYGYYIGHIELKIDSVKKAILRKTAQVYKTEELPAEQQDDYQIDEWVERGKQLLQQEVVTIERDFTTDWFNPSSLPMLLCEAVHEWTKADCTLINSGLVLGDLKKGSVSEYDLHALLPHPINPCAITLSGAELKEVIKQSFNKDWPTLELKGLGFRGKVMGNFVFKGLTINENLNEMSVNGKKIQLHEEYRLGTTDMFTFGHFFPELKRAKKQYYMPEFLRDVLAWKLKKQH